MEVFTEPPHFDGGVGEVLRQVESVVVPVVAVVRASPVGCGIEEFRERGEQAVSAVDELVQYRGASRASALARTALLRVCSRLP
ncbi:hypothetical protein ACPCAE_03785 [Streptomyces cinereoruber]|uniref:hypothetical protein n=1 Tax=Streptomyces cinereoruber TaxID=67260 RepID=UPI003C2ABC3D